MITAPSMPARTHRQLSMLLAAGMIGLADRAMRGLCLVNTYCKLLEQSRRVDGICSLRLKLGLETNTSKSDSVCTIPSKEALPSKP